MSKPITLEEAFALADSIHHLIVDESTHAMNYLTLECLGVYDHDNKGLWAASFDSVIASDDEWYEHVERFEFSARARTPADAINLAADKLLAKYPKFKGSLGDYELNVAESQTT